MAKYDNCGKINPEKIIESTIASGGGVTSRQKDDHIHNTAYSKDGRRISWDEYPDGSIKDVHSSKDGRSYTQYKDS